MLLFYLSLLDTPEEQNKFKLLYKKYRQLLYFVANKILHDERAAEDAVHQAFLRVLENFSKIGEIDCHKTRSYLVIIVRGIAINMYNKLKRHGALSIDDESFPPGLLAREDSTESLGTLEHAIAALPPLLGDALTLKYVQGLENREIAHLLGIPEATVRKRLERAREKLREALEQEGISVG